jgi:hypothetical protein
MIILPAINFPKILIAISCCLYLSACAEFKAAGRTIGHTTRDVTREIGHGTRDAAKSIGRGTKRVVKSVAAEEQ